MSELLTKLERRLSEGLRFHEWKDGDFKSATAEASLAEMHLPLERRGLYAVARPAGVPDLWTALRNSLRQTLPLIVLPSSSSVEEEILLRQLPATPPPGAILALFTSGTSGEPKAVFHSERSLRASVEQLSKIFPTQAPSACLLPPWGMAGIIFHCLLPIERGSSVLFSKESLLRWGPGLTARLQELEVGFVTLNPFLLEMLLRCGLDSSWKGSVVSLTAPLKRTQKTAYSLLAGRKLLEIYGMTETAGPVLFEGKSLGAALRISLSQELEIQGPQLMLGYSSAGVFEAASDWFRTGDTFLHEGDIFSHQARIRDLIDMGGRKVSPRLIEEAVEGMPEIAECLAFSMELSGLERPGLLYVRKPDCSMPPEQLAQMLEKYMEQSLSAELRPRWWREIEAIPRLKNGKPDRKAAKSHWDCLEKDPKASISTS